MHIRTGTSVSANEARDVLSVFEVCLANKEAPDTEQWWLLVAFAHQSKRDPVPICCLEQRHLPRVNESIVVCS